MWESVRGSGCRGTHFYFGATRAMKLTEEWAQKNIDRTLDGVEVVSLEETGGRRHRVVRLYVDHPDGVNHALCARVSGAMENALDSAGYMDGPYNLEVSSPGLERPLKKKVHFASHVGEKVYVKTFGTVQGQKVWRGEIVTGIVQQSDNRYTLVDLGRVEALLPKSEQVSTERYEHGMRVKAVIKEVSHNPKGPPVILSRRSDEMVHRLFELEFPEMADGLVEIVGVAREPGYRAKISVISHSDGVDPVSACVGPRGSRVRMVVSELRGEKIDIIPFNEEPARFVAKALSPARVREVLLDDEKMEATVVVPDDQLS